MLELEEVLKQEEIAYRHGRHKMALDELGRILQAKDFTSKSWKKRVKQIIRLVLDTYWEKYLAEWKAPKVFAAYYSKKQKKLVSQFLGTSGEVRYSTLEGGEIRVTEVKRVGHNTEHSVWIKSNFEDAIPLGIVEEIIWHS